MLDFMLDLFYRSALVVPLSFTPFVGGFVACSVVAFAFILVRRFFSCTK